MANQLLSKKGNAQSRMTVSLIGGLETSTGELGWRDAFGTSCGIDGSGEATAACHCFAGASAQDYADWCQFTPGPEDAPACDALPASRYVDFADSFDRRSFSSICNGDDSGFGEALRRFALLATEACFALDGLSPFEQDAANIRVRRRAREQSSGVEMEELDYVGDTGERGWYYDARENKICLSRIERRIGDRYSVLVVHTNDVDYSR